MYHLPLRTTDGVARRPMADSYRAIRQFPAVVLAIAIAFGFLGAWYAERRPPTFVATAGMLFEEARPSSTGGARDPERYVADQVAILRSPIVAERASELAATAEPPAQISPEAIAQNLSVESNPESNFVEVSFVADDAISAQTGANSIPLAYQQALQGALADNAQTTIARLDDAIRKVIDEIASLQVRIEQNTDEPSIQDEQLGTIVAQLVQLREPDREGTAGSGSDSIERMSARADQLKSVLETRLTSFDPASPVPDDISLLRRQKDAAALLSQLTVRRGQAVVDAELASGGVAFFTAAGPGRRASIPVASAALVMTVVGALIGAAIAYLLSSHRPRLKDAHSASSLLGAPLLVEVPGPPVRRGISAALGLKTKRDGRGTIPIPPLEDPASGQADAFRVLAGAIRRELTSPRPPGLMALGGSAPHPARHVEHRAVLLACVSAMSREANALVGVNLAVAVALTGLRVAVLDGTTDGDDGSLLEHVGSTRARTGLDDVVHGSAELEDALEVLELDRAVLSVVRIGRLTDSRPGLLGSPAVGAIIKELATHFDLIVACLPPVLETAHTIAMQEADSALIVVPAGSRVNEVLDMRHRIEVMGVPVIGYAYLRKEALGGASGAGFRSGGQSEDRPPAREQADERDRPQAPIVRSGSR